MKKAIQKKKFSIFNCIIFIFLLLFAVSLLVLLFWAFSTSLKSIADFRTNKLWLPSGHIWEWSWSNYQEVLKHAIITVYYQGGGDAEIGIGLQALNSLIFCVGCSFAGTFTPCLIAYAAAKFNYKFNSVIYGIVIVTMSLPIIGSYPSELQILNALGIYDTYFGMLIQKANFLSVYFLVFYANFKMVPNAFSESAYIDGASELRTMLQINFPMVMNTAFTVFLLQFISYWNDYQTIILYMPTHPTLSLSIFRIGTSTDNALSRPPMSLAGSFVLVIPILIIFILLKDRITENLSMGGIKE